MDRPLALGLDELRELATDEVDCRLTSVTRWSVRAAWRGVLASRLVDMVRPAAGSTVRRSSPPSAVRTPPPSTCPISRTRGRCSRSRRTAPTCPWNTADRCGPCSRTSGGTRAPRASSRSSFVDAYESGYWETRGLRGRRRHRGDQAVRPELAHDAGAPGRGGDVVSVEPHRTDLTVRSYECDSYGHVNNAVYLNYLEVARHELLAALGMDYAALRAAGPAWSSPASTSATGGPWSEGDALAIFSRADQAPARRGDHGAAHPEGRRGGRRGGGHLGVDRLRGAGPRRCRPQFDVEGLWP